MIVRIANSEDHDQTASRNSLIWLCNVCVGNKKQSDLGLHHLSRQPVFRILEQLLHGLKFKISKVLYFRNSNFKTCRMPTKMNNFKFK